MSAFVCTGSVFLKSVVVERNCTFSASFFRPTSTSCLRGSNKAVLVMRQNAKPLKAPFNH